MRLPRKIDRQKYTTPDSRQIANLRLKHRITQSELANILCVTSNTVSIWERGERSMPSTLWRLACYELGEVNEVRRADVVKELQEVSLTDIINEMTEELRSKGVEPI